MINTGREPLIGVRLLFTDAIGEEIESRLVSIKKKPGVLLN
jgi:hypothetical protein